MSRNTVAVALTLGIMAILGPAQSTGNVYIALSPLLEALGADPDPAPPTAAAPMVEITKTCPSLRYVGRDATFEIVVTNRGDAPANNVVVTDVISGAIDFRDADNGGVREGNNIVWRLGSLDAGQSRTLKANFRCNTIGKIRNTATVTYCAESSDMCELDVQGIPAILLECVDSPDPIEVNGNVTYTITVTNQGTAVGTNIQIRCTLPDQQEYVSGDGPTSPTNSGKDVTFAPLASLAPKATATFKITVKGTDVGDVRFRVEMKSDQTETPVMETESTHIY